MNLRPGFDQTLLGLRQAATEALDRIDCKDRGLILIVRVKMRPVVWLAHLDEHANDDSEEPRELRHQINLASSARMGFDGLSACGSLAAAADGRFKPPRRRLAADKCSRSEAAVPLGQRYSD
jgi:hypothetical protein